MTVDAAFSIDPECVPYTHLRFKNDPDEFQFAFLSDNAGGSRPGVLAAAVRMLNLLQPEIVVGLGDLVEGYTAPDGSPATEQTYRDWWREIDEQLADLEMPLFFLAGNHDVNTPPSVAVWRERYGGTREYYHFRYNNVLFLMLSTEDPPKDTDALIRDDPAQAKVLDDAYHAFKEAAAAGAPGERLLVLAAPRGAFWGSSAGSAARVGSFRGVRAGNRDGRWTFETTHAPPGWGPPDAVRDPGTSAPNEEVLADRDYTVVAAHTHTYNYTRRNGRDYITTAMTGALNVPRLGAIDHVVWVTMTKDGPKIANLLLNGILDKHGPVEGDHTVEFGMYHPPAG